MRKSLSDGSGKHMFIYAMMLGSFGAMTGKDKRAAFRKWIHKSAKAGSPMGMVVWAAIEFHGNNGATSNKADAKRWMLKAARTGNADAQTMLGQYYIFGLFGQADIQTGLHWLHEAAHHGGVKAQNLLGILLVTGKKHVPKKAVEGVQWAEQGIEDPTARGSDLGYYALGYAYEHGTGGKKVDFAKAWYDFAAAQRLDIKHQLKDVNVRLSEVAPKLSASQINQLHKNVLKIPLPKKKKGFNP
jgi:TPR repeat protein